jgi:hypothetical protein
MTNYSTRKLNRYLAAADRVLARPYVAYCVALTFWAAVALMIVVRP